MKTIEPPRNLSPRLHRDGTVSYWSFAECRWIDHTAHVPDEELDRLDPWRRERVIRHLSRGDRCSRR
jgi:hypothetical protein